MSGDLSIREIGQRIYFIRGHRVMLDTDLADLYQVLPKALNQAVRRNRDRFPEDFMFQITWEEYELLRSQIVTLKTGHGQHRKYPPFVFTEQGLAMLSSVLRSKRAIQVNIAIMRAFVKLREMLDTNKELARKIAQMERKYDDQFKIVFDAIRAILHPTGPLKRKAIGLKPE